MRPSVHARMVRTMATQKGQRLRQLRLFSPHEVLGRSMGFSRRSRRTGTPLRRSLSTLFGKVLIAPLLACSLRSPEAS
jgi:hypothetical protein